MYKIVIYNLLAILVLNSCEDIDKLQIGETINPVLSAEIGSEAIELTIENENELFPSFEWTKADFGYPSGDAEYVLEMDFVDNNFSSPINLTNTLELSMVSTNAFINKKLLTLGALPSKPYDVEFKVTGNIESTLLAPSNSLRATIIPYEVTLTYPKLYLTGDNNGWGFNEDDLLYSVKDDEVYEGFIYMDNGEAYTGFKLSYEPNWDNADAIIGDINESGTSGTLQVGNWGGNSIYGAEGIGVYFIEADITAETYTIYKSDWALTGDFNSWGFLDLNYDVNTDTWSITNDFTSGGFKFIANQDWGIMKGDDELDGILDKGTDGNNIIIEEDGNYTVTLDLSNSLYTYTIVRNN